MPTAKYYWKNHEFHKQEMHLRSLIRIGRGQKGGLNPPAYYRRLRKQLDFRRGNKTYAVRNREACKKWRAKVIAATGGATSRHDQIYKLIREKQKPLERKRNAQKVKDAQAALKKLWTKRRRETRGWRTRKKIDANAGYIVRFFNAAWHRDFEKGEVSGKKPSKKIVSKKSKQVS